MYMCIGYLGVWLWIFVLSYLVHAWLFALKNILWSQGRLRFIPLTAAHKDVDIAPKHLYISLCTGAHGHAALLFLLQDKLMQAVCNLEWYNKVSTLC